MAISSNVWGWFGTSVLTDAGGNNINHNLDGNVYDLTGGDLDFYGYDAGLGLYDANDDGRINDNDTDDSTGGNGDAFISPSGNQTVNEIGLFVDSIYTYIDSNTGEIETYTASTRFWQMHNTGDVYMRMSDADLAAAPDGFHPKNVTSVTLGTWDGIEYARGVVDFFDDPICFTRGAMIETDKGCKAVEDLQVGDKVKTMHSGYQHIRWIGSRKVAAKGSFAPVHFKAGIFGNVVDFEVSQRHRMYLSGFRAETLFGTSGILVEAKDLIDDDTIFIREGGKVEYFHLMLDNHEIIFADGVPSESFNPSREGIDSLLPAQREEVLALFPNLVNETNIKRPAAYVINSAEVDLLRYVMIAYDKLHL